MGGWHSRSRKLSRTSRSVRCRWLPRLPIDPLQIGNSLFDPAGSEKVAGLVEKAKKNGVKLVLPVDYITGDKFDKGAQVHSLDFH